MYGIERLDPGYGRFFSAIEAWAKSCDGVLAFFVSGSVASKSADAFSDLDVLVIARLDAIDDLMNQAVKVIGDVEPCVIVNRLGAQDSRVLSTVTNQWHRVDIQFGTVNSLLLRQPLVPVFDHASLEAGTSTDAGALPRDPDRLLATATEFLRVLGLSVVVLGREDIHAAHDGANLLRGRLIDLFLMEPSAGKRSSAKKLLPALSAEQRDLLKSLPPLADDRQKIVAFSQAIAAIFLPRARRLLESWGGAWPTDLEEATRAYLERNGVLSI